MMCTIICLTSFSLSLIIVYHHFGDLSTVF
nr:MAG TPA: hypothetical protein [Caudoviricetes sp.]